MDWDISWAVKPLSSVPGGKCSSKPGVWWMGQLA